MHLLAHIPNLISLEVSVEEGSFWRDDAFQPADTPECIPSVLEMAGKKNTMRELVLPIRWKGGDSSVEGLTRIAELAPQLEKVTLTVDPSLPLNASSGSSHATISHSASHLTHLTIRDPWMRRADHALPGLERQKEVARLLHSSFPKLEKLTVVDDRGWEDVEGDRTIWWRDVRWFILDLREQDARNM